MRLTRSARAERDRTAERELLAASLPLSSACYRHSEPWHGVWLVTADHPRRWELWPPGTVDFHRSAPNRARPEPAAWLPCDRGTVRDGFDPSRADPPGEPPTLAEIRCWARPWIGHVAGSPVVQDMHGWSPPWGDGRSSYVILATVR